MNPETLLALYTKMLQLRVFDQICVELKREDLILDGFHSYQGQEAVAVGVLSHLGSEDYVLSSHRPQGHALARGADPGRLFAEMMGRTGGVGGGRGGPMTFSDWEHHLVATSTVGSGVPIAGGVALALELRGRPGIAVSLFGDGAANTGACHEGVNLAGVWHLPVVFVCENNQYGEALPFARSTAAKRISDRAVGYGMEGLTIDGMDVIAVFEAAGRCVEQVRKGEGPVLLEVMTYRFRGHYEGDPDNYRTSEEIAAWRAKCPLEQLQERLMEEGIVQQARLMQLKEEITGLMQRARNWALAQPVPRMEDLYGAVLEVSS